MAGLCALASQLARRGRYVPTSAPAPGGVLHWPSFQTGERTEKEWIRDFLLILGRILNPVIKPLAPKETRLVDVYGL